MLLIKPGIQAHPTELVWYLTTHQSTYVIGVDIKTKTVLNLYWGPRLLTLNDVELPVKLPRERSSQDPAITSAPEEFPVFGGLRYGPDVLRIEFDNGTRELDLIYTDAIINDSQELIITLKDKVHKSLEVRLHYKLDIKNNLILRHTVLENLAKITENESFRISKAQTAAWHIPPPPLGRQRELVTLAGAWSSETQVQRHSIQPGTSHLLQSTRGIPSAQVYPYFAIRDPDINETYFGTLGWSGNWEIEIHTDIENQTTITGGMHDRDFGLILSQDHPNLELPVFVAGFTSEGLSGARLSLTNHIRDSKNTDGKKKVDSIFDDELIAPVLYNGWEAFGFQVGYANQKKMAEKAAALGIELFVVDDGWFHGRHSDKAGLGDWFVDKLKFPLGLRPLADHVHNLGMQFGLWFEPEMVNPNSNLYRKHPDWVYFYPERTRHEARNQLVLNICKPEVQQYLLESIVAIVNEVGVDYIKWDMNRPISEAGGSPELGKIVWINHVKSFHYLIEQVKLRSNHPIKIESCCSGGGRADLSILKRVQSCWPSDNTRPDARLLIQYGASLIMPPNMMSCWVTDSPNDDPHTIIPIPYRFHVSFMGALGIGSNLNKLNTDEFETYRRWIVLYKSIRHVLQKGNLDWLVIPTMNNVSCCITQTTTQMGDESVILAFRQTSPFWFPLRPIRLRRLIAIAMYDVRIWSDDPLIPVFTGIISGTALMNRGLSLPYLTSKAYSSVVVHIKQKL